MALPLKDKSKQINHCSDNEDMERLIVLNALNISTYAEEEIYEGKNSLDYAISTAHKLAGNSGKIIILCPKNSNNKIYSGLETVALKENRILSLVKTLIEISKGYENIFLFNADCPLVDVGLAEKMYKNHKKYFCEYTFADGYPKGLTVEIIKSSILASLIQLIKDKEVTHRDSIFSLIERDINAFEVETEISPDDQRLLRIALFPDTKRNYIQLRSIAQKVFYQTFK